MRWRLLALVLLGANILLVMLWLYSGRGRIQSTFGETAAIAGSTAKTNLVVRKQLFSWQEVESADYPTYIANLRSIGCPEQTIRDIIIADVNALYARRRATEVLTPDQQWWRSEPDTNVLQIALDRSRALDDERKGLLSRLLGPSWELGDMVNLPRPSRSGVVLDGPVLGTLPQDIKQALQDVNVRSQDRMQAYLESQLRDGKNPDPVELAKLRQQTRDELARILSPSQLEEFLLRYSQNASDLRNDLGQLRFFNATPDEFRSMLRSTDALDQKIQLLSGTDENTVQARKALENQRESAIKLALGDRRYEEYRSLQDPLYREAVASAQEAGTPEAARALYEINLASAAEQDRIKADASLSAEQKNIELKKIELEQLKANTVATGQELPPELPPLPPSGPPRRTYVLHQGDTAAVVSLIYGVPIGALRQANPNINMNRLRPGDQLVIPPTTLPPPGAP